MSSVYCCVGMYFLFVVILCAVSLAASIIVMYVHNRSGGMKAELEMPTWVRLPSDLLFFCAVYRVNRLILRCLCTHELSRLISSLFGGTVVLMRGGLHGRFTDKIIIIIYHVTRTQKK